VSLLYVVAGLIGGASTLFTSTWSYVSSLPHFQQPRIVGSRNWRLVYAAGMLLGGALFVLVSGRPAFVTGVPAWQLLVGGFVVGFGARLSNGCTSGHGVCGIALLKPQSLLAVLTFLATGIVTAHLVRQLGGS
jgi:uncharacterized membrane protein YedE/YeeE